MRARSLVVIVAGLAIFGFNFGCGSDAGSPGGDAAHQSDSMVAADAASGDAEPDPADAGQQDAEVVDAGNLCGPQDIGPCLDQALDCLCCPAGGPMNNCLCTTECTSDNDCTDSARPMCNQMNPGSPGICTATDYPCAWGSVCAAPDTPIATPSGMRQLASLKVGELVYSLHEGSMQAVPIARVSRTAVWSHRVRRVRLSNGVVLLVSPGHPRADGRPFASLVAGDSLGEQRVTEVRDVAYPHARTHDILPASDTGTYVAGGALIGSTLHAR